MAAPSLNSSPVSSRRSKRWLGEDPCNQQVTCLQKYWSLAYLWSRDLLCARVFSKPTYCTPRRPWGRGWSRFQWGRERTTEDVTIWPASLVELATCRRASERMRPQTPYTARSQANRVNCRVHLNRVVVSFTQKLHSGETQKLTSHPAVSALKNLYQFKAFTERSS